MRPGSLRIRVSAANRRKYLTSLGVPPPPVIFSRSWHRACNPAARRSHPEDQRLRVEQHLRRLRRFERDRALSNMESLVVVKLDHNGGEALLVFEVLEQAGLLEEVSEHDVEMVEPGAVGFRVPRERMDAVVLALECGGFVNVRAYEVQAGHDSAR
jgi:hypothetical protein